MYMLPHLSVLNGCYHDQHLEFEVPLNLFEILHRSVGLLLSYFKTIVVTVISQNITMVK